MEQHELIFKQLANLRAETPRNLDKESELIAELKARGFNVPTEGNERTVIIKSNYDVVQGQRIDIESDCESDHHQPFEDEGAPDDDFID